MNVSKLSVFRVNSKAHATFAIVRNLTVGKPIADGTHQTDNELPLLQLVNSAARYNTGTQNTENGCNDSVGKRI